MLDNLKKSYGGILVILIISCMFMAFVDAVWRPGYGVKSVLKIVAFLIVPVIYSQTSKEVRLKPLFEVKSRGMLRAGAFGLEVFIFILACYFTIGNFFDFSQVTGALSENVGVNKENFVFVALYISFANSLLEEFFFRGFAFMSLRRLASRRFAYIVSSLTFALYHVAMMVGWFEWPLFLLLFTALVVAGFIFDRLNEKQGNIYTSWFVHMFANFAINTVGFILFGII